MFFFFFFFFFSETILKYPVKSWISWWSWRGKCQVSLGLVWPEAVSVDVQSHWLGHRAIIIIWNYIHIYVLALYNYIYYNHFYLFFSYTFRFQVDKTAVNAVVGTISSEYNGDPKFYTVLPSCGAKIVKL